MSTPTRTAQAQNNDANTGTIHDTNEQEHRYKFLLLSHKDSDILTLNTAQQKLPLDFPPIETADLCAMKTDTDMLDILKEKTRTRSGTTAQMVIVVRLLGRGVPGFQHLLNFVRQNSNHSLIVVSGIPGSLEPDLTAMCTNVSTETILECLKYFHADGCSHNMEHMFRFLANQLLLLVLPHGFEYDAPTPQPNHGLYHPRLVGTNNRAEATALYLNKCKRAKDNKPTVGIIFYRCHYLSGNTAFVDALIDELEAINVNAIGLFTESLREHEAHDNIHGKKVKRFPTALTYLLDEITGACQVDGLISTMAFALGEVNPDGPTLGSWSTDALEALNVPVLQAINSVGTRKEWVESSRGLNPLDTAMNVAIPEFDGRIITVPVSFKAPQDETNNVHYYEPVQDRVEAVAKQAKKLALLRYKPNSSKRIAFMLTNSSGKAQRVGDAVGLDSPASLMTVFQAMQEVGYNLGKDLPKDGDTLIQTLIDRCSYDEIYLTEDQLANAAGKVPAEVYQPMFDRLPTKQKEHMVDQWGEAPGVAYVHQDEIALAGLEYGNMFLALQPPRGYGMDPDKIYHTPDLPPPHNYFALYRWLRDVWKADAIVHMGKHGTLEWLPGKGVGLSSDCFPDSFLDDLPLIYPFIINDPGEGTQAKRRGHALIIDHLTPPMTTADGYGELAQLMQLVDEYYQIEMLDPSKLPLIQGQIWTLIQKINLDEDMAFIFRHDHDHDHEVDIQGEHTNEHHVHDHDHRDIEGEHSHHEHHSYPGHEHEYADDKPKNEASRHHSHGHSRQLSETEKPAHNHERGQSIKDPASEAASHNHSHDHVHSNERPKKEGSSNDNNGGQKELSQMVQEHDHGHEDGQKAPPKEADGQDDSQRSGHSHKEQTDSKKESSTENNAIDHDHMNGLDKSFLAKMDGKDFAHLIEDMDGYLCELAGAQIRDGLHVLGQVPRGETMVDMLQALTRLPNLDVPSLREAVSEMFGLDATELLSNQGARLSDIAPILTRLADRPLVTSGDAVETIDELAKHILARLDQQQFDAQTIPGTLAQTFPGLADTAELSEISQVLEFVCATLVPSLKDTTHEISNLLKAMNGEFVPAGPSGSPTRGMAHLLPTGRNFYAVDPQALPSFAAWEVGQGLAREVLIRYIAETGSYPEHVAISVWGTAAMRTHGDDIAQIFALLGVRPTWQRENHRVTGVELVSLSELKRPRIDVTVRISGFFRDAFPHLITLLDEAVNLAINADEPPDQNFIRKHFLEDMAQEDAEETSARYRVFGCPPGAYGIGILDLIEAQNWKDESDFAKCYINWGGYAYSSNEPEGVDARTEFTHRLTSVEVAIHNQDDREHDIFDSDDYFQFHGGMIATIKALSGKQPKGYFGDTQNPATPKVRDIKEETLRVYRTRVVNPKWLESISRHGYKGASEMAATVDYLFGFDATANVVSDFMYEQVAQRYALDEATQDFFEKSNPWALRGISERLMEAAQRGMWEEPSVETLEALRQTLLKTDSMLEGRSDPSS